MAKIIETDVESDNAENNPELAAKGAISSNVLPKNFRHQADMEAFYRFVHENDLREEALTIFDETRAQKNLLKAAKSRVKH